jgi:hypothetical protein
MVVAHGVVADNVTGTTNGLQNGGHDNRLCKLVWRNGRRVVDAVTP